MKRVKVFVYILLFGLFTSCGVVQQVSKVANLAKCEFRLSSIQYLKMAGIDIQNIKSMDKLALTDLGKVTKAFVNKSLTITFVLNLQVKNPNSTPAGMSQLDWILAINGKDMVNGRVSQPINVPANGGITTIPLGISFNIQNILNNQSLDDITKILFGLVGQNNTPVNITVRAKPTITIENIPLQYPDYININTTFTSL